MKFPVRSFAIPIAIALLLAACSDDGDPAPTTAPPAPATPPSEIPPTESATTVTSSPPATTAATTPPDTAAPTTTTTRLPATTTTEPGPRRISIDVYDGIAEGEPHVAVERGEEVELIVTSDVPDEVHVHGYDFKADVVPGTAAVITFVADLPGIYEVELEESGLLLVELEVR